MTWPPHFILKWSFSKRIRLGPFDPRWLSRPGHWVISGDDIQLKGSLGAGLVECRAALRDANMSYDDPKEEELNTDY